MRRREENFTQQELAVRAFGDESKKARISELENGKVKKPSAEIISGLAIALNISHEEISILKAFGNNPDLGHMDIYSHRIPVSRVSLRSAKSGLALNKTETAIQNSLVRGFDDTKNIIFALETLLAEFHESKKIISLCFMDIDGATQINRVHGKNALNASISELEKLLSHVLVGRPAFRIGGDEFLFIKVSDSTSESEEDLFNYMDRIEQNHWDLVTNIPGFFVKAKAGIAHLIPKNLDMMQYGYNFEARRWLTRAYNAMIYAKRYNKLYFSAPTFLDNRHVIARQYEYEVYCSMGDEVHVDNVYNIYAKHSKNWGSRQNIIVDSQDDISCRTSLKSFQFSDPEFDYEEHKKRYFERLERLYTKNN